MHTSPHKLADSDADLMLDSCMTDMESMASVHVQIKVKTLTGKEIEIDIESDDTISRIKERVEEKEGGLARNRVDVWEGGRKPAKAFC